MVDAAEIVRRTTQTFAGDGHSVEHAHLAREAGVSDTTVLRIWRAHGLKPHLVRGFKISRDPKFVEKLEDVVGLYMSPPEHALVLCCDEESGAGARPYPARPAIEKGRAQTMTHDYKRNGTTTFVCSAQRSGRQSHRTVSAAPHPPSG